jgi:hypothetical protein
MKVKEISKGLFLYTFPNQYDLASSFIRLQEFYESPYKDIKGKYFTLEKYMDRYAKDQKDNKFTYFEDWDGFNVPGNVVHQFEIKFLNKCTNKETKLLGDLPVSTLDISDNFYIIGCVEGKEEAMKHEIAHGFYYLNKEYKKEMNHLLKQLPKTMAEKFEANLKKRGYCKQVMKDEIHAYLATGLRKGMVSPIDYLINLRLIDQFQITFDKYYEEIK